MPGITKEWKRHVSENKIEYEMKIFDFDMKMNSWRPGRKVYSKEFFIGESKFQLEIYPNGMFKSF